MPQKEQQRAELRRAALDYHEFPTPGKVAIADALAISVRTVEVHRARVFEKMNVKSAVELANLLREPSGSANKS